MPRTEDIKTRRSATTDERAGGALAPVFGIADLDPLLQASSRVLDAWLAVGSEMLAFSKARFDRSVDLGRAMARSTSVSETIDLQADFTRATVQDYLSEANKLADLGARSLLSTIPAATTAAEAPLHQAEAAD